MRRPATVTAALAELRRRGVAAASELELRVRRRLLDLDRRPTAAGAYVLRQWALLGADGVPLAEVVESFAREALFLPERGR